MNINAVPFYVASMWSTFLDPNCKRTNSCNYEYDVYSLCDHCRLSNIRIDDLINRVEILEQPEKITFSDIIRVIND